VRDMRDRTEILFRDLLETLRSCTSASALALRGETPVPVEVEESYKILRECLKTEDGTRALEQVIRHSCLHALFGVLYMLDGNSPLGMELFLMLVDGHTKEDLRPVPAGYVSEFSYYLHTHIDETFEDKS
jgi:hypothetical protein